MFMRQLAAALLVSLSLAAAPAIAAADANQASQAELETVKGIGPALSGRIVAARQQSTFKDWPDFVERVGGVGPGNAARFSQAGLTVAGKPYSAAPVATAAQTKPGAKPAPELPAKAGAKPAQP